MDEDNDRKPRIPGWLLVTLAAVIAVGFAAYLTLANSDAEERDFRNKLEQLGYSTDQYQVEKPYFRIASLQATGNISFGTHGCQLVLGRHSSGDIVVRRLGQRSGDQLATLLQMDGGAEGRGLRNIDHANLQKYLEGFLPDGC